MRAQDPRRSIVRLLSLMQGAKEARQYLQRFSELDKTRFAVIKVGGAILRDARETLADALAFLQSVGLTPVVVHGGGPQLDAALEAAGVESRRSDGLRVTTPEVLAVARDVFLAENIALVEAVRAAGARAAAIPTGVFDARIMDEDRLGLVGEPVRARLELIESAANAGAVPVLTPLGLADDARLVNINADAAVRALVGALQPYKVVFLTPTGGVLDGEGALITTINLATDYEPLMAQEWLAGGMRLKVGEIKRMLDDLPLSSSVSITRPEALTQELFTHGGAGTLLRLGERIAVTSEKAGLDAGRVEALVEGAFARPPPPEWWGDFDLDRAIVSQRYRAGAFVSRLAGAAYLDKFAVLEEARGEGLGQAVWRRLVAEFPVLFWRARPDNPIVEFYFRECEGAVRGDDWIVFWRGVSDMAAAAALVGAAMARPATFSDAAP